MKLLTELETGFELRLDDKKVQSSEERFKTLVLGAVDSALSILGNSPKLIVYRYLESRFGLKQEDIPSNIANFTSALESIFGDAAVIIEARILQILHRKVRGFKYFPERQELSLVSYVESLRAFL